MRSRVAGRLPQSPEGPTLNGPTSKIQIAGVAVSERSNTQEACVTKNERRYLPCHSFHP
jgi:hypothetical protein